MSETRKAKLERAYSEKQAWKDDMAGLVARAKRLDAEIVVTRAALATATADRERLETEVAKMKIVIGASGLPA